MKTRSENLEKLNVKDYITIGIFTVLTILVYAVVGTPFGISAIGTVFIFGACGLLWGSIFLLLFTKVNKKNVVLVFGLLIALISIINFWAISAFIAIGAIIAEFVWRSREKNTVTMIICFTIQITMWNLGLMLTLIFMKDMFLSASAGFSEVYTEFYHLITGPFFIVSLGSTIIGCILGGLIGKKVLKKHFEKAGII